jgi:hypothetical protein
MAQGRLKARASSAAFALRERSPVDVGSLMSNEGHRSIPTRSRRLVISLSHFVVGMGVTKIAGINPWSSTYRPRSSKADA